MARSYSKIFAILKQINAAGIPLTKEELVSDFTNNRTASLSDLSVNELGQLEANLIAMAPNKQKPNNYATDGRDKQRKGIIAIFKSIGRSTEDAISWAEKYGVKDIKRKFNDYSSQELYVLLRNAETVRADFLKSINKKLI